MQDIITKKIKQFNIILNDIRTDFQTLFGRW